MSRILDFPSLVLLVSLIFLWLSTRIGAFIADRIRPVREDERDDLSLVSNASLTLLALIIGFSFSMAVSRYDQRKSDEREEASAIGTEYLRVDTLPAADAAKMHQLLVQFLDQRLTFYQTHNPQRLRAVDTETARLEGEMWASVLAVAKTQPTPTVALAEAGMNDVINWQGYAQAARWNRIPTGAWALLGGIALCCCLLTGYGAHRRRGILSLILPFLIAIAFGFIADIDSPLRGFIPVAPQNLINLSQSLHVDRVRSN